jgi:uncharacterized damage-inducible protein DinB
MATATQAPPTAFVMGFQHMMLEQLMREMEKTSKVLAAIPNSKSDWRPDDKARTASELAAHIAAVDVSFLEGIASLSFAELMDQEKSGNITASLPKDSAGLAQWYEEHFAAAIESVRKMTPEQLSTILDFYGAFQLPAFAYLLFVNNHSIHHRGQLACYLRPMGSKVPSIYGGSADEPWEG